MDLTFTIKHERVGILKEFININRWYKKNRLTEKIYCLGCAAEIEVNGDENKCSKDCPLQTIMDAIEISEKEMPKSRLNEIE